MVYLPTYANPLYSTSDLSQPAILHIRPTSTWFYSCKMDLWIKLVLSYGVSVQQYFGPTGCHTKHDS